MTTDHGGSIPHASKAPDWRTLPRYERVHDTITAADAIGVLLSNRPDRVWLDQADYQRIVAAHGAIRWLWEKRIESVVLRDRPRHVVPVARLILGEDTPGFVGYHDDDPLNLRGANLSVTARQRPRRDGSSKAKVERVAQRKREVEERKALRAEKALKAAEAVRAEKALRATKMAAERAERALKAAEKAKKPRKRISQDTTVRPIAPPPPLSSRPQVAGAIPMKLMSAVQAVKRTSR